ncbi:MAG: hypothetical protein EZS28_002917 [Streblomastix strix]|uniref:Uncharacterized protein n=1 Tax=Streblomastix strix TaxID=222440 RepID=A0A5J4X2T0_9EUKA|nr:MAG: hypothetical protein EZS28_002917 [Streblomastix strix]
MFQVWRQSTLGQCLGEALDEIASAGLFSRDRTEYLDEQDHALSIATAKEEIMLEFDKSIEERLSSRKDPICQAKGILTNHRGYNNLWNLRVEGNVDFICKLERVQANTVDFLCCNAALGRPDNQQSKNDDETSGSSGKAKQNTKKRPK